ncbi:MAG: D-glycero-beta-D-manno-heptose 1-phosphate adenylyltransferase [Phormidesmis sp.]
MKTFPQESAHLPAYQLIALTERFAHLRVLVIGEAMLDRYLQGKTDRICREAPVPIVDIERSQNVPGGAANTAANAATLGAETFLLSVVGCDRTYEHLQSALAERGVKTDSIIADPTRTTLAKHRLLAGDQLLVRFDQGSTEPIAGGLEDRLIAQLRHYFPRCDAVIVSDYGYGILTPRVCSALQQLQTQTPRVLVADSKQLEAYAEVGVTAVKPNYEEAIRLLNLERYSSHQRIAQMTRYGQAAITKTGAQMAAITLDVDGTLTFLRDTPPVRTYAQPAPSAHATGAGDTYVATLAMALAAGANPHGASLLAAAATAVTTAEPGTTCCSPGALRRLLAQQNKRITNSTELAAVVAQHRLLQQRIVFTNGCFDILHSGHVTCLEQARSLGDILIVGVNTDESIRQLKGDTRPVNLLTDRLTVLAALGCVSYVVPFGDLSPRELIRQIRPDVYTKGGDYTRQTLPETPLIEEMGGEVVILPYVSDRSTTQLIEKIQRPTDAL